MRPAVTMTAVLRPTAGSRFKIPSWFSCCPESLHTLYVKMRIKAAVVTFYNCKMTWQAYLMSPWFWVPAFFLVSLGAKRWMPLFATLTVIVATVWWDQMLGDMIRWISNWEVLLDFTQSHMILIEWIRVRHEIGWNSCWKRSEFLFKSSLTKITPSWIHVFPCTHSF